MLNYISTVVPVREREREGGREGECVSQITGSHYDSSRSFSL